MPDRSLAGVVGAKTAKALESLGIATPDELLRHYPRRYVQRGELTDLAALRVDDDVTVLARVLAADLRRLGPGRQHGQARPRDILEVVVTDGTGRLKLTFFNQAWRAKELAAGSVGLFAGTVGSFRGELQLLHPEYQLLNDSLGADLAALEYARALIPVYPATAKLPTWRIAACVRLALAAAADDPDPLGRPLRDRAGVIGLREALAWIHEPESYAQVQRARQRLIWDEAFQLQVVLAQRRARVAAAPALPRPGRVGGLLSRFEAALPFSLTAGQLEVGEVLAAELAGSHPMHRLLQGEVGSGKTVVALRAMLQVVDSGGQAALLAPTEVLAAQHARTLAGMLGPLAAGGQLGGDPDATRIVLLTGSARAAARRAALLDAASGAAGIVIGTHALLEEQVRFADLGLIVIDEQHRFGVEQRAALAAKSRDGTRAHTLVMTATPIPRTVAMTVFGDLDVSTLSELPAGRSPLTTHVVAAAERPAHLARVWQRAREEVAAGRQVYVVCPRISASEPDAAVDATPGAASAAVEEVLPRLRQRELDGLRVAGLTGQLAATDKDDIMARFTQADRPDGIDVLVATTVIEVGVDVPNATLMIVLDADRFGISQLHQLRGRVGRGRQPGLCLLVTNAAEGTAARERLAAVAGTTDGFVLSRVDLTMRREGDILGAAQSGTKRALRLLSVVRDEEVINRARVLAAELVAEDPQLSGHPVLAARLSELFEPERAEFLDKA